jgi:hypothetical protein
MSQGEVIVHRLIDHIPGHLRLRNRACLIAGACTDIGLTIARVFASEGCRILAVDQDAPALRAVVGTIEEEGGCASYRQVNMAKSQNLEDSLGLLNISFQQFDIVIDGCFRNSAEEPMQSTVTGVEEDDNATVVERLTLRVISRCSSRAKDKPATSRFSQNVVESYASSPFRINTICFRYIPQPIAVESVLGRPTLPVQLRSVASLDQRAIKLQIANAALFFASEEAGLIDGASLFINPNNLPGIPQNQ